MPSFKTHAAVFNDVTGRMHLFDKYLKLQIECTNKSSLQKIEMRPKDKFPNVSKNLVKYKMTTDPTKLILFPF